MVRETYLSLSFSLFLASARVSITKGWNFSGRPLSPYDRLNSNWIKRNRKYSLDTLQTELVVFFFKRLILRRRETHFRPISLLYPILGVSKRTPYSIRRDSRIYGANKHRRKRSPPDKQENGDIHLRLVRHESLLKTNSSETNEWKRKNSV